MERRLAAILVADVVGYSRLMGENEADTLDSLRAHQTELVEPKIAEYDGRIVKLMGDGILAEFPSAVKAVLCAVQIQQLMADRTADKPEGRRITYRMGINVGDVIVQDGDIFGDGVNVAARLEGMAEPGGVCISRTLRDQIRDKLDLNLEDMGEAQVKNIARPVRSFRIVLDDKAAAVLTPVAPVCASPKMKSGPMLAAMAGLVLATAGVGAWIAVPLFTSIVAERPASLSAVRLSIAVLPFSNLSGVKDQDYLADALTEDLTADLSRISGSFVISRSTAATYRGQTLDVRQIARELNVRYVLEGNVRKTGETVRVSARLSDGQTGQQVWSERYTKTAGDMYTFQNEVTGRVARTLNLELKDALSRQAARERVANPDAEDLTLRAWAELWTKPQSPVTNQAALSYVQRALEIDPDNSEAHGVAAYAYARAATYGWGLERPDAVRKGIVAGERSLALDPKNADATYALAFLFFSAGDTARAKELLHQCIELNRNHAPAYFFYGLTLIRLGRPGDAIEWVERAFALSPRDPLRAVWHGVIARVHVVLGDDERAVEAAKKGIAANHNHAHNYAALASALALLDRMKEAKLALQQFERVQLGITVSKYLNIVAGDQSVAKKTYERLIVGLRKAGLPQ